MTLNAKIGVFIDFWRFLAAKHISGENCVEINWNKHGYKLRKKIFSIKRLEFDGPSLNFIRSSKPALEGIKKRTPVKVVILQLLACLSWKRLQIGMGMGMLPITTSISNELFSLINIDDFERPWAFKIRGFYWFFAIFGCSAHSKNELRQNGWR